MSKSLKTLIPEAIFNEIVESVKNLRPFQKRVLEDLAVGYDPAKDKSKVIVIATPRKAGKSFLANAFKEVFKRMEEQERKQKEWQEKYGKEKVIFT